MVTSDPEHGDEGLAFALTIGAGAASVIGGAVVFHKKWVKLASHRVLAMSLAASAGVMLYVSFVELMAEAVVEFEIHNPEPGRAVTIATLCFFLGMLFTAGLGRLVHILDDHHSHDAGKELGELGGHVDGPALSAGAMDDLANVVTPPDTCSHCDNASQAGRHHVEPGGLLSPGSQQQQPSGDGNMDVAGFTPDTPAVPATAQPDDAGGVSAAMEDRASHPAPVTAVDAAPRSHGVDASEHAGHAAGVSPAVGTDDADAAAGVIVSVPDTPVPADEDQAKHTVPEHERKKLRNMGLLTALAIGIHNLPEGLTTFVATLASPSVGAALAVAIAIHNVPEGVCVAVPIYFASGSRWSGFLWSLVAAVAEPLGALVGYAIIRISSNSDGHVHPNVYGSLFGIVAGIMVYICVQELIPMSLKYDPHNKVSTKAMIGGMALMAFSLVLFDWT